MEIKRQAEVSVKTSRRLIIRPEKNAGQIVCAECGEMMLAVESLAALLGISRRAVYRAIETGTVHFVETEAGAVMICGASAAAILPASGTTVDGTIIRQEFENQEGKIDE